MKIISFYSPSSRNIVDLKFEVKLDCSIRFGIDEVVRVYYELILYKDLDTVDTVVCHLESGTSVDEKIFFDPFFLPYFPLKSLLMDFNPFAAFSHPILQIK